MMRIHGIAITLCLLFGVIVGNVDNNAFEELKNNFRALQDRVDAQNAIIRQLVAQNEKQARLNRELQNRKGTRILSVLLQIFSHWESEKSKITIRSVDGIG